MNFALINDTTLDSHHGCDIVTKNIKSVLQKYGIAISKTIFCGKRFSAQDLVGLDIQGIIVNGEGTLHHSQQRAVDLIDDLAEVYKATSLPIYLINATIDANELALYESFSMFRKIFVRETKSKIELEKYAISSVVVPDMTFYSDYSRLAGGARYGVGFTDSVYQDVASAMYRYCAKDDGYSYLPLINSNKYASRKQIIRQAKRKIYAFFMKLVGIVPDERYVKHQYYIEDNEAFVERLASLKLLVTARYHGLCLAIQTRTPFIAVASNSHKVQGLLEDIGLSKSRLAKLSDINPDLIARLDSYTDEEQALLDRYLLAATENIDKMAAEIAGDLQSLVTTVVNGSSC